MNDQRTIYCGARHRTTDGAPIAHNCRILAPEYLEAERLEEYGRAASVLERMPLILHPGVAESARDVQARGPRGLARPDHTQPPELPAGS
ncbi:MAG TPA: hypothetical protein VLC54_19030 [Anaeromyxobacter sp.]|nr:hypothetical protein [Anaeromyxobacter sp.]